jgi:hypothetical protein
MKTLTQNNPNCQQGLLVPAPIYLKASEYLEPSELKLLCGEKLESYPYNPDCNGLISVDFLRFSIKQTDIEFKGFDKQQIKTIDKHWKNQISDIIKHLDKHFPFGVQTELETPNNLTQSEKIERKLEDKNTQLSRVWKSGKSIEWYDKCLQNSYGIKIVWQSNEKLNNHGYFNVVVPGKPLRMLPFFKQVEFLKSCQFLGWRCTRIDGAIDVFDRALLDIDDVEKAARKNNFCHAKSWQIIESRKGAKTIYFGSRKSERMARFYMKNWESCPELTEALLEVHGVDLYWLRAEFELKRESAKEFIKLAVSIYESIIHQDFNPSDPFHYQKDSHYHPLVSLWKGFLACTVDFIQKKNEHLERCPRLEWWENFISYSPKIDIKKERIEFTDLPVQRAVKYLRKQVSKILTGLRIHFKDDSKFWAFLDENCFIPAFESFSDKPDYCLDNYTEKWVNNTW